MSLAEQSQTSWSSLSEDLPPDTKALRKAEKTVEELNTEIRRLRHLEEQRLQRIQELENTERTMRGKIQTLQEKNFRLSEWYDFENYLKTKYKNRVAVLKETLRQIRENAHAELETSEEESEYILVETAEEPGDPNQRGPDGGQEATVNFETK